MKTLRHIGVMLLICVILVSQSTVFAYADSATLPETAISYTATVADDTSGIKTVSRGDTVTFFMRVTGTKQVSGVPADAGYRGAYVTINYDTNALSYVADSLKAQNGFSIVTADGDLTAQGRLRFAAVNSEDIESNAAFAMFTLKVSDDAAEGTYNITIATAEITGYDDVVEDIDGSGNIVFQGTNAGLSLPHIDALKVNDAVKVEAGSGGGGGGGGGGGAGGGGGSSKPDTEYTITIANTENGTAEASAKTAKAGDRITVTVNPDDGYTPKNITVSGKDGSVSTTENSDGTYSFIMPESDVTVTATFEKKKPQTVSDDTGVSRYLETEDHLVFIRGYPDGSVQPNGSISRAETATMLFRLLKDKDVRMTVGFLDVGDNEWYTEAVLKLAALGIINGYPDGTFRPSQPITRAEFTVMAARFAYATEGKMFFKDVQDGYWAVKQILTAASYGWIEGYEDQTFRPGNNITRAEAAAVLNRMLGRKADMTYAAANEAKLIHFTDLDKAWYYADIIESSNGHDYEMENGTERWTAIRN